MNEERVEGLVEQVREYLHDDEGPDMAAVMDLAGQLDLPEEAQKQMMEDIRNFMDGLIREILDKMNMNPEERERALTGLGEALNTLSPRDYMIVMGDVFSGKSDMGAVDDFINTTFEMPDVS
jgi:hypothetical protein